MDCRLVWAVVPSDGHTTYEDILDSRSQALAERLMKKTEHSMRLEEQSVPYGDSTGQIASMASELKAKADPRMWDPGT